MAYNVLAKLENYEVRNVQARTLKNGRYARFVRLESPDAAFTCEVSVWDEDLFEVVDSMRKGDTADFRVRCSAGDYEGITLVGIDAAGYASDSVDY